ncbi:cellulose binding domain-containing protein [Microbispora sp. H13382]|uniref:cellulose binding domain-containing protein n=1 Tax=Microbispora sp. H13382 TaxID=2729112 RepID=UPI00160245FB|nr:cellulose binding domain-containing protein [Microbispora sp. H13382]
MPRLSWPAAWAAAGAVAAALLAANIAAPPVLAGGAAELHAVRALTTVSPSPSPSPGADVTPPTAPGDLRACPPPPPPSGSFQGVVGLCWTASSDDTTEYKVFLLRNDGFYEVASTSRTTAVVPGLVHGRTYTFYVVARDAAGNTSRPSELLSTPAVSGANVTPTPPTGDTTPPTRPTGIQANCLPDFKGTSFCWTSSTDNVGVTGYDVYRRTAVGWTRVGTPIGTHFTEGNLVTGQSYVYFMVAKDAAGNLSLPSDLVTATASGGYPTYSPPPVSCKIEYTAWSWSGGFAATVKIINLGQAPMNNWTLRFVLPDAGQKVTSGWSATWSQSGKDVTAAAMSWNSVIPGGGSLQIGFNGSFTGANPDPTGFTLNGGTCIRG